MGLSSAVGWWEEWQMRILVLGSLFVQYLLFFSARKRKSAMPSWFRSLIWLAYLGSDALAIYTLATLFAHQRKQRYNSAQGNSILEVVGVPVLLMHLSGQDGITAYNIEDNELWRRHVLTAVSQITVAIYVFCKSWPGSDKRLLQAAILFFVPGILKCIEKPWALKSASIHSLANSSSGSALKSGIGVDKIHSLEEFVKQARALADCHTQGEGDEVVDLEDDHPPEKRNSDEVVDLEENPPPAKIKRGNVVLEPYKLFVDLASSYADQLGILESFWVLNISEAYDSLEEGISATFDLLYTKAKVFSDAKVNTDNLTLLETVSLWLRIVAIFLPFAAIGLFHKSHRETYNHYDVNVTYALFCCTAVLEFWCLMIQETMPSFHPMVAQHSLIGLFARVEKHTKKMYIVSFFKCKDLLDQHWCMKSCSSSPRITTLVLRHVKSWWMEHIQDAASYRRFNNHRSQWTIQRTGCYQELGWSLNMPFDESVLLWHIATDLCFYHIDASLYHRCATAQCKRTSNNDCATWCERSPHHESAMVCREMSNYMVYLLFVNPEMLLPGTRPDLFKTASAKLKEILKNDRPSIKEISKGKKQSPEEIDRGIVQRIIAKVQPTECREVIECTEEVVECIDSPPDAIRDAWKLSQALLALGDEKIWEVIEGVWVEMLCFSASRCRGYLHAKSMGSGVELLTFVWLLLSCMGMETFPERMQRTELSSEGGYAGAAPSAPQVSTVTGQGTN